ncbi:hypothetical protein BCE02nite_23160 [Brevibacillus centrosporus]|uniref:YheC/D like ATP-grasp n=1 Tax=Brevibacillus centrosporus TaxID=54910 RepID=A0A1I3XEU7_9BACL|nr:hypothetical protein BCE02nite_23160 [Brevibacillus centrosporus]SFK18058.1 hypothetical protein SAMN05518846_109203 [Brevibacillus centrosporus]
MCPGIGLRVVGASQVLFSFFRFKQVPSTHGSPVTKDVVRIFTALFLGIHQTGRRTYGDGKHPCLEKEWQVLFRKSERQEKGEQFRGGAVLSEAKTAEVKRRLVQLGYQISRYFDRFKRRSELGIDFAVDKTGRIYLIEVNHEVPSHVLFLKLKDKSHFHNIRRLARAYKNVKKVDKFGGKNFLVVFAFFVRTPVFFRRVSLKGELGKEFQEKGRFGASLPI